MLLDMLHSHLSSQRDVIGFDIQAYEGVVWLGTPLLTTNYVSLGRRRVDASVLVRRADKGGLAERLAQETPHMPGPFPCFTPHAPSDKGGTTPGQGQVFGAFGRLITLKTVLSILGGICALDISEKE